MRVRPRARVRVRPGMRARVRPRVIVSTVVQCRESEKGFVGVRLPEARGRRVVSEMSEVQET